ncbi:response regulator [[Phormidium] sp. LEGE 05292]|uniref:response regulator n=1 Tax=[Phormidium] sp. LEGE 05292 TaxID=767427 RepID=UPI002AD30829|nr:response regulator [Phormidium sp. LEGE 05292]
MPNKILVIDDSGVIRKTVKDMLPAGKFEIVEAKDGVEGLNLAKKERPNWIMLDFILPKMSGWDVYQELEKQPELRKIPLVVMSGRKEEVTSKIPDASFKFVEFLVKPFDQKQLMAALKSSMEKVKLRVAAAPTTAATAAPAATAKPAAAGDGASAGEIQALKQQIAKLNAEVEALKKQQAQIMTFIKQKLK